VYAVKDSKKITAKNMQEKTSNDLFMGFSLAVIFIYALSALHAPIDKSES